EVPISGTSSHDDDPVVAKSEIRDLDWVCVAAPAPVLRHVRTAFRSRQPGVHRLVSARGPAGQRPWRILSGGRSDVRDRWLRRCARGTGGTDPTPAGPR